METSQDWLETFGLASDVKDSESDLSLQVRAKARLPLVPLKSPPKPSSLSLQARRLAKAVLLREQQDKEEAQLYQASLVHSRDEFIDGGNKWQQKPHKPLIRQDKTRDSEIREKIKDNLGLIRKTRRMKIIGRSIHHRLVMKTKEV